MFIRKVYPLSDPLWRQLIEQNPSSVFHSQQWIRVLTRTYQFTIEALVLVDDAGRPLAGIPFCEVEDIRGRRILTLPFSDYCDPLVGDLSQWKCLIDELIRRDCAISIRCLHNEVPLSDSRFEFSNRAKWHGLSLQPDLETLWQGLDSSARRAIRKAEQNGVAVRIARHEEELRAFFDMHLEVRKYKYQLLAQPYSFFKHIWEQFVETNTGWILLAEHQNQIIGGVFFLAWKDGLYYKFNASYSAHQSLRPNDLIIWEGIKQAKVEGYNHLDFGLSDWEQEGLVRYKRKFASEEKTISFLRYVPDAEEPGEDKKQIRTLLPKLTKLFTDESVPDTITERAGELLYKFFV